MCSHPIAMRRVIASSAVRCVLYEQCMRCFEHIESPLDTAAANRFDAAERQTLMTRFDYDELTFIAGR